MFLALGSEVQAKGISKTHFGTKSCLFWAVCVRPQRGLGLCLPPCSFGSAALPAARRILAARAIFFVINIL
jgi:hypothetical protein